MIIIYLILIKIIYCINISQKNVVNIYNINSNLCLTYKDDENKLRLSNCDGNNIKQQWIIPKSDSGFYVNNYNTKLYIYIKNNTVISDIYFKNEPINYNKVSNNDNYKCLEIYEKDKSLIMDNNIRKTDQIRVFMNTCNFSNKNQHWKLRKISLNGDKKITAFINKVDMYRENISHTITTENECLSETLSSSFFMKGFLNNICINENYYTNPYYSKQCLEDIYSPPFESFNKYLFYYLMEREGFNNAYSRLTNISKNVAIFNVCWGRNYGAVLTGYALQTSLVNLGYNPYSIKYISKNKVRKSSDIFWQFERDNLFTSKYIVGYNLNELKKLNKYYDNFIVGSDQVWRLKYFEKQYKVYFLSFVEKSKKKIACAASFGQNYWEGSKNITNEVKNYLKNFNAISVREKSGVDICKNTFRVKAKAIFDPVFHLRKNDWKKLFDYKSKLNLKSSCLIYVLDNTKLLTNQINTILKKIKIPGFWIKVGRTNMYDFLKSIDSSQRVITDSFHGLCFSIIFQKDFICLCNKNRGEDRFISLLSDLGLMDRLFYDLNKVDWKKLPPIDYKNVNKIIEQKRQESIEFLMNSLEK